SSVEAAQVRSTSEFETGMALRPLGVDGAVVSPGAPEQCTDPESRRLPAVLTKPYAAPFWFNCSFNAPKAVGEVSKPIAIRVSVLLNCWIPWPPEPTTNCLMPDGSGW